MNREWELLLLVGISLSVGALMWAMTIAVSARPRQGAVLPPPAWPRTRTPPGTHRAFYSVAPILAAGVVFAALYLDHTPAHLPALELMVFGLPAAYTDARELRLPNQLTYGLAAVAAITVLALTSTGLPGNTGPALRALGCGTGYALLLLAIALFTPTGRPLKGDAGASSSTTATAVGLGDIKLAAGLGIVLGWSSLGALTTALLFTAGGHLLWLFGCTLTKRLRQRHSMSGTALGPWMILGALIGLTLAQHAAV
jgi:leader peptidase (prepilin peptidase)/N-methyltransferase